MSDRVLSVLGCYLGFGFGMGIIFSEGHPLRILALVFLFLVTLFTAMEYHVRKVCG